MAATKEMNQLQGLTREVNFKDLELVLQKNFADENMHVINYTASDFIPLGENFGSVMVKLDVIIQRGVDSKPEKLNLVAKTINPSDRPIIHWPSSLRREVFIYTELLPAYRDLEREAGILESNLIDLLPKYYGHRCSLNRQSDYIDDDSLFLMENLKMKGYYTGNKVAGVDKDHTKLTMTALARYHALGIALKLKKPDFYKKVLALTQPEMLGADFEQLDEGFLGVLKNFQESPCFSKHLSTIESSFTSCLNGKIFTKPAEEPWITIIHGDLWVNNVLFHKNEAGNLDDVKFIDFQGYVCNSPLIDVARFLLASLEYHFMINNFDEFLDIYYDKFTSSLEQLGCSSKPYSKDAFDKELKKQAIFQFPICAMARKFSAYKLQDEKNSSELLTTIFETGSSDSIIKSYQDLISIFEKKGWF